MFVGRKRELARMEREYARDGFSFVTVRGRRRIGKTRLIKEFMKGKKGLYFSAREIPAEDNLELLAQDLFECEGPTDASLELVLSEVFRRARDERFVLAIDEYPRLCDRGSGTSSVLQEYIDRYGDGSKLFLILCGSSMTMMEKEVTGKESPLYGRRTETVELKPFTYFESRLLLEGFSEEDRFRIYGMTGGMPAYLMRFDPSRTLEDTLVEEFIESGSYFRGESSAILMQEIAGSGVHRRVLYAIASGHCRSSEISTKVGCSAPLTARYLNELVDLGLVARTSPVDNRSEKIVRYAIRDEFLGFYYRRIYRLSEDMGEEEMRAAARRVLELHDADLGRVFERVSSQYLRYAWGGADGTWWGTDPVTRTVQEIDLVLASERDGVETGLFVECKYTREKVGADVLEDLVYKSKLVKRFASRRYALCSRSGFADGLEGRGDVLLLTLEDMVDGYPVRGGPPQIPIHSLPTILFSAAMAESDARYDVLGLSGDGTL